MQLRWLTDGAWRRGGGERMEKGGEDDGEECCWDWKGGEGGVKVKVSVRTEVSGTSVRSLEGEWQLTVAVGQGFACTCWILLF